MFVYIEAQHLCGFRVYAAAWGYCFHSRFSMVFADTGLGRSG